MIEYMLWNQWVSLGHTGDTPPSFVIEGGKETAVEKDYAIARKGKK